MLTRQGAQRKRFEQETGIVLFKNQQECNAAYKDFCDGADRELLIARISDGLVGLIVLLVHRTGIDVTTAIELVPTKNGTVLDRDLFAIAYHLREKEKEEMGANTKTKPDKKKRRK